MFCPLFIFPNQHFFLFSFFDKIIPAGLVYICIFSLIGWEEKIVYLNIINMQTSQALEQIIFTFSYMQKKKKKKKVLTAIYFHFLIAFYIILCCIYHLL